MVAYDAVVLTSPALAAQGMKDLLECVQYMAGLCEVAPTPLDPKGCVNALHVVG
jgi:hypothetical protein